MKKKEVKAEVCPLCGKELVDVVWAGEGPPNVPMREGSYLVDPGGWQRKNYPKIKTD